MAAIFLEGRRSYLIGQYAQARKQHRPSGQIWARLRNVTSAELLAEEAAYRCACVAARDVCLAEAMARIRAERIKLLALVAAGVVVALASALPFALAVLP